MNNEWETPKWLFDIFNEEVGGFHLDAAASHYNALCPNYFTKEDDALEQSWWSPRVESQTQYVWLNPPFQNPLQEQFLLKAYKECQEAFVQRKRLVVYSIIPSTPETNRWINAVSKASEIRFLSPRIRYIDAESHREIGAPKWGTALVIFEYPRPHRKPQVAWQKILKPKKKRR